MHALPPLALDTRSLFDPHPHCPLRGRMIFHLVCCLVCYLVCSPVRASA